MEFFSRRMSCWLVLPALCMWELPVCTVRHTKCNYWKKELQDDERSSYLLFKDFLFTKYFSKIWVTSDLFWEVTHCILRALKLTHPFLSETRKMNRWFLPVLFSLRGSPFSLPVVMLSCITAFNCLWAPAGLCVSPLAWPTSLQNCESLGTG